MTIPYGQQGDFYHIFLEDNVTASNQNLQLSYQPTPTNWPTTTLPKNISATQWSHGFGPFEAGDSSISSYNVDTTRERELVGLEQGLDGEFLEPHKEFVFDRTDVRVVFITLYSLVFCCCFFGNLMVILVVTLSRRLRSITNFFLANLAVADLCVGIFCVMQNLSIYLITSWMFGDFLCKMYQFVHSLSSTASIFILVVICMERYFAIIHPITCKQTLTSKRLRLVIVGVWITSAIYSLPKFIYFHTVTVENDQSGNSETICVPNRRIYNSEVFDMINFGFLYITPLLVMTLLYSRIAITLWQSSRQLDYCIPMQNVPASVMTSTAATSVSATRNGRGEEHNQVGGVGTSKAAKVEQALEMNRNGSRRRGFSPCDMQQQPGVTGADNSNMFVQHKMVPIPQYSYNILRARRGVIRMLIVVVLTFALCNLPFHARKIWQYWSKDYVGDSNFNALFTPLTFLVSYFNSGVNPLLYAFLSRNFRSGVQEVFQCVFKRANKKNGSSSFRAAGPIHSMATETNLM